MDAEQGRVNPVSRVPDPTTAAGEVWDTDDDQDDGLILPDEDDVTTLTSTGAPNGDTGARRSGKARKKKAGFELSTRDVEILRFLTRYRYATYNQLSRAFDVTPSSLRHRLPKLKDEGLLSRSTLGQAVGKSGVGVWLPTGVGIKACGMDMKTPKLSWGTAAHNLGLVDLGIAFALTGETVVTEREIRATDIRGRLSARHQRGSSTLVAGSSDQAGEEGWVYAVPLGTGKSAYIHIPDLVLERAGLVSGRSGSFAIELELNSKPPAQWRKILRAYAESDQFAGVVYYTPDKAIARGLDAAAKAVGAAHAVEVRRFHPVELASTADSA